MLNTMIKGLPVTEAAMVTVQQGVLRITELTLGYLTYVQRLYEHLAQEETELQNIKWHVLGLYRILRVREDTITLDLGHLLYSREGDQRSQGGVGLLVTKAFSNNVKETYLILQLSVVIYRKTNN